MSEHEIRADTPYDPAGAGVEVLGKKLNRDWFNPWWLEREKFWRLAELCYRGGEAFICSQNPVTLFKHARETTTSYLDRRRRAYYRNHAEAIISLKSDAIFQPQVARAQKGESETFQEFLTDVDGRGTNADPFFGELARWAMAYGEQWAGIAMPAAQGLADAARARGDLVSEREARDAKLGPRYYMLSPRCVIDWREDERGQLDYVIVVEHESKREPFAKNPKPALVFRKIDRAVEQRYALNDRGEAAPIGPAMPHGFGEVPLVRMRIRHDGRSQLEDICRMLLAVFNLDSMTMEQASRQTFNQLVFKVADPAAAMAVVTGSEAVIPMKPGDDAVWLSPNVQTLAALRELAWEIVDEIWATSHLRSRPGGKGQQPATDTSGVAYAYEWKAAEADLFGIATAIEEVDLRLGKMRARALKLEPSGYQASYSREFDIRALRARADEASALLKVNVGATAAAEIRKGLVDKALPKAAASVKAEIHREIEELSRREAAAPAPTAGALLPPNQGMQPPGRGAGENRVDRAFNDGDEVEVDDEG